MARKRSSSLLDVRRDIPKDIPITPRLITIKQSESRPTAQRLLPSVLALGVPLRAVGEVAVAVRSNVAFV